MKFFTFWRTESIFVIYMYQPSYMPSKSPKILLTSWKRKGTLKSYYLNLQQRVQQLLRLINSLKIVSYKPSIWLLNEEFLLQDSIWVFLWKKRTSAEWTRILILICPFVKAGSVKYMIAIAELSNFIIFLKENQANSA